MTTTAPTSIARMAARTLAALITAAVLTIGCATASSATTAAPQPAHRHAAATVAPRLTHLSTITNAAPDGTVVPKLDTAGQQIDAHEGTIVYDQGLYWMVGNTYGCGYQWIHAPSAWCGFRTYSSPDLVNWTNRSSTFNPTDGYWQSLCSGMGCFDARLIRDTTASPTQWRMWFNAYNSRSGYVVMSAPSITGPWRLMPTPNLAIGNNNPGRGNGAGGLFLDPTTGVGYLIYAAWTAGGLDIIEKLDPHMITGTGVHVHVPNLGAEAPSLFRAPDGTMVVTYDDPGCAWCGGVPTAYATSSAPLGLWYLRGQISPLSCNGQASAQVATLPGGINLWVTDQWTNVMPGPRFGPDWTGMSDINAVGNWNQTDATQHWEPLNIGPGGVVAPITCAATITVPVP